jgi:hypothetical protein
MRPN